MTSNTRITTAHSKALGRQVLLACRTPVEVDRVAHTVCDAYGLADEVPAGRTWADCARALVRCMDDASDEIRLPRPLMPPASASLRALADFLHDVELRRGELEPGEVRSLHLDPTGLPTRCQMCAANHPFEEEVFPFCSYRCAATDSLEEYRELARCYACGIIDAEFDRSLDSGEDDDRAFCLGCATGKSDAAIEALRAGTISRLRAEAAERDVRRRAAATREV
jgi:endogenous inhibitor of DNA gyrase (YacG/DUF329 family)